jgi:hypothetical protein
MKGVDAMPPLKDLTGKRFGKLLVIKRAENINGRVAWTCLCDCGREHVVRTGDLTTGHIQSCGKCNYKYENNLYEFKNGYVIGYDPKGRQFYIDEEDLFKIKHITWHVNEYGYVEGSFKGERIRLHRFLMNPRDDEIVDHKNRKPYDNRKSNLRICNDAENMKNKSKHKNNRSGVTGVFWHKKRNRWRAEITVNYKTIYLGEYKNFEDAVKARKEAEKKYFGEFAPSHND